MREVDALVVGAGPAGATAALNLAPFCRTLLVDRRPSSAPRIGESLVPAARRLLADMGLLEAFLAEGHAPHHGNRAWWNSDVAQETDFLRDPDGPGWHLDRPRFEAFLRRCAQRRGAELVTPTRLIDLAPCDAGEAWRARLQHEHGTEDVVCRLVLDATGRAATVARRLGATRRAHDRLVCGWVHGETDGETAATAGFSAVEAEPAGWWYTAPIPTGRVLAFHTDSHLPETAIVASPPQLLERAGERHGIAPLLHATRFRPNGRHGITAACSAVLEPEAGEGWAALGDAAVSFDPLASRGLFNALYTGLLAAECGFRYLRGERQSFEAYRHELRRIAATYTRQLRYWYGTEQRWPTSPFWSHRRPKPGT